MHRLYSAAFADRDIFLYEIESVKGHCVQMRQHLLSLPVPCMSELIASHAVQDFAEIIAYYCKDNGRPIRTKIFDRKTHHDICENMLKAVLLPCLSVLNVGCVKSNFVQGLLIGLLHFVANIKTLIMPPVQNPRHIKVFVKKIKILSYLQTFQFHDSCTTEIIVELSKHCPHLKSISVAYSRGIKSDSVEHLLKFKHLHTLNVAGTLLSLVDYEALISGLPHIRGLFWYNQFDSVLKNVICLPSVTTFCGKISDLDLLVQKCPNIKECIIISPTGAISTLGQMRCIVEIMVANGCWTTIMFSDVTRSLGATLTVIELHRVVNINIIDLIKYCTVLNFLAFKDCQITNAEILDSKLPHFQNLKILKLKKNKGPFDFSSVLYKYVNLNVFYVEDMEVVTDSFIRQIVTAGGFRHLESFCVDGCGDMSTLTAWLLMQNCPNLTALGNIRSWPAVTEIDVQTVLNFVIDNNPSLTIHL
jgi:hypothetical protein